MGYPIVLTIVGNWISWATVGIEGGGGGSGSGLLLWLQAKENKSSIKNNDLTFMVRLASFCLPFGYLLFWHFKHFFPYEISLCLIKFPFI